jgi:hypothetical protein
MRLKGESRIEENNESIHHPGRIELKEKVFKIYLFLILSSNWRIKIIQRE